MANNQHTKLIGKYMQSKGTGIDYLLLHLLFMFNATGGIFSKRAGMAPLFSKTFFINYMGIFAVMVVYAICWQQLLKRIPLTVAMANKSATVIWGIVLGALVFHETITIWNIVGACIIIIGILMFVRTEQEEQK